MKILVSSVSAVVPALLLLRYFYKQDLLPEPRSVLMRTFALGILATVPIVIVGIPLRFVLVEMPRPFWHALFISFICAGLVEELFKLCVVTGYSARNPAFDEPMDGVVYGVAASLGFAALENILYVYSGGWGVALIRAFTAVPTHACLGALLGHYVGQARFSGNGRGLILKGFVIAVVMHGLYDFPIFLARDAMVQAITDGGAITPTQMWSFAAMGLVGPVGVLIVLIVWVRRIVGRLKQEQRESLIGSGKWLRESG